MHLRDRRRGERPPWARLMIRAVLRQFLNKCVLLRKKLARGVRVVDSVPSYGTKPNEPEIAARCTCSIVALPLGGLAKIPLLTSSPSSRPRYRFPLAIQGHLPAALAGPARLLLVPHFRRGASRSHTALPLSHCFPIRCCFLPLCDSIFRAVIICPPLSDVSALAAHCAISGGAPSHAHRIGQNV